MAKKAVKQRFVELDLLRTLAIAMMIVYHGMFDLAVFFGVLDINPLAGGWWLLARSTAGLFLLLAGISFVISRERNPRYVKTLKRGLTILGYGILISMVTYVFDHESYIRFGILHMIGVSVLILPFFRHLKKWNVLLGLAVVLLGNILPQTPIHIPTLTPVFIPLGFPPPDFTTLDYFPLLPWFGVILMGTGIGEIFYAGKKSKMSPNTFLSALSWPGRHALLIYLIHQPILIVLISGFLAVK